MTKQKATNVHWHEGEVSRIDRAKLLGQHGATVWFTGLSGSGKSTVMVAVERALYQRSRLTYRLDGDNIRLGINRNLGFSEDDRSENIRRIGEVAKLFVDAGVIVLSGFISPYRKDREAVRRLHDKSDMPFVEVFIDVPISIAESRDPKGLYKKARAGEIKNFTGIDDPYEPPESAEIILHSHELSIEQEVDLVLRHLEDQGIIESVTRNS